MSSPNQIAVVGASGRTGGIIFDGLLSSETDFDVTALARASSIASDAYRDLGKKGVKVVVADLLGPRKDLVEILQGIDIVVSAIIFNHLDGQIPLAEAAKEAGVKRFVPCSWDI